MDGRFIVRISWNFPWSTFWDTTRGSHPQKTKISICGGQRRICWVINECKGLFVDDSGAHSQRKHVFSCEINLLEPMYAENGSNLGSWQLLTVWGTFFPADHPHEWRSPCEAAGSVLMCFLHLVVANLQLWFSDIFQHSLTKDKDFPLPV